MHPINQYPQRKKLSTKFKNYTGYGNYFVTMVCHSRKHILSQIVCGKVELTPAGSIVENVWKRIPGKFEQAHLGEYVLMPDHFHGIILISPKPELEPISLGQVIHWFKTWTSNEYHKYGNRTGQTSLGKLWLRSYNESRIPRGPAYNLVERYIRENPKKWQLRNPSHSGGCPRG